MSASVGTTVNRRTIDRWFYTWVALGMALIILAGFARSYYLKGVFGTPALPLLLHVHGLVMTTWFALFFVQVRLVATHRTDIHRRLGVAGAAVAGLVVTVGAGTALGRHSPIRRTAREASGSAIFHG